MVKPEGERTLRGLRRMWEDNIKIDLREAGRDAGNWIDIARDRDQRRACARAVINLRFHLRSISLLVSKSDIIH